MSNTAISISHIFNSEIINGPTHKQSTIIAAIACSNEGPDGGGLLRFFVPAGEYRRAFIQPTPTVSFRTLANLGAQPKLPTADANIDRYKIIKDIWSDNSKNYKA